MGFWVPRRRYDPELMDREDNQRAVLDRALADIRAVNRWLGGAGTLLRALDPFLDALAEGMTLTVLDIGTGAGDLPLAIVEHARRRGRLARVVAVDRDPVTVELARDWVGDRDEVRVECGDAFELPYEDGSFDVVTASMFLHHFDEQASVRLLSEFRRVARRAVLINDLRRHRLPWLFIAAVAHLTARDAMFRHDAPLSVLRGFTRHELARLAAESGATDSVVERRWPFRLAATIPA